MSGLSNWGPVVIIILGSVIGFYFQNRRIDDLRDAMNGRFSDLKDFIKSEVSRLEDRIERIEHPVVKP
jgi:3-polyprenyl-4-hydroxybenzoate decarboxylase